MGKVATGRPSLGQHGGGDILEAKFGDGFREGAREAGGLRDGTEIRQPLRGRGGVNDACGERLDAESRNSSERKTSHGLSGELGGQVSESERVHALAANAKSVRCNFGGSGPRGRHDHDFRVNRLCCEEGGGVLKQRGVGTGMKQRTRGHRQLYGVRRASSRRARIAG